MQLRLVALDHFVSSAAWAVRVRDAALVRSAARHAVVSGRPISNAAGRRMRLLSPYCALLDTLARVGDCTHEGLQLRSDMYAVALQCLADGSQFDAGLKLAEEAFSALPPTYSAELWSSRLLFQSKLGRDVTLSLAAMREVSLKRA
jgi:hypothetical protein